MITSHITNSAQGRLTPLADRIDKFLNGSEGFKLQFAARRRDPSFLLEPAHDADRSFDGRPHLFGQLTLREGKNHSVLAL